MNNRRVFLGGVAAAGAFALSGCEKVQQTIEAAGVLLNQGKGSKRFPNYRYRLTVEVDTPEGLKRGSSVIEVRTAISGPNKIPSPGMLMSDIRGEAVTINLGKRGLMFALLRSETGLEWAHGAMFAAIPNRTKEEMIRLAEAQIDPFELDMQALLQLPLEREYEVKRYGQFPQLNKDPPKRYEAYPLLVRFRDLKDPATIERVPLEDPGSVLGEGVTIKRVTVAKTEAPVTSGLVRTLPWLKTQIGSLVKYPRGTHLADIPLVHQLYDGDFSAGRE